MSSIIPATSQFLTILVVTFFVFLQPSKVPPISELGSDAYLELPSAKELIEAFKPKKGSVKALLLDQVLHRGRGVLV